MAKLNGAERGGLRARTEAAAATPSARRTDIQMTVEEAAQQVVDMGGRRPRFMLRKPDGTLTPVSKEEYHTNVF